MLAAGVAGWVGAGFGEAGAVAVCGGGDLAAAGPVSAVCAAVVIAGVEDVAGAVNVIGIEGSGCPGRRNCSCFSY